MTYQKSTGTLYRILPSIPFPQSSVLDLNDLLYCEILKYKTKLVHLTFALIFRLGGLGLLSCVHNAGNTMSLVLAIAAQKWSQWLAWSLWQGVNHLFPRVEIDDFVSKFQVLKIFRSESGWGYPSNSRLSPKECIFERLIIIPDHPENLSKKYSRRKKLGPKN